MVDLKLNVLGGAKAGRSVREFVAINVIEVWVPEPLLPLAAASKTGAPTSHAVWKSHHQRDVGSGGCS